MRERESKKRNVKRINTLNTTLEQKINLPAIQKVIGRGSSERRHTCPSSDLPTTSSSPKWKLRHLFMDKYLIQSPQRDDENNEPSPITQPFKAPKSPINNFRIFFTNNSETAIKKQSPTHSQRIGSLNSAIQKSKDFISLIRNNRKKIVQLHISDINNVRGSMQKVEAPKKIYNYLSRKLVIRKERLISDEMVDRFVGYSPPEKLKHIEAQSRQFLMEKMAGDYRSHTAAREFRKESIKSLMTEEMDKRKESFARDYRNRYNIPYFSYLTLNPQQKRNVLIRHSFL